MLGTSRSTLTMEVLYQLSYVGASQDPTASVTLL
jgi:hypothetical protein